MWKNTSVFLLCAWGVASWAAPVIYWASDPIAPGEILLVAGEGFSTKPAVTIAPIIAKEKPIAVAVWQANDRGFKCRVPKAFKPGQYFLTVRSNNGSASRVLNRPVLWTWRGDLGATAVPGGELQLLGRNLSLFGGAATLTLSGPQTRRFLCKTDGYSARLTLPADLPPGAYKAQISNGPGVASEPVVIPVVKRPATPMRRLNVRDFGAEGTGERDDTAAIQAALDQAGAAGGGLVFLPRGRYQCTEMLRVPPNVALVGEQRELTALFWPDFADPPEALIRGTHDFTLRELTIYASHHRHIIMGDLGGNPQAGNVRLERLRVRADAYRGHLRPEDVDARFRLSLQLSTGGGDTVRLGGENIVIRDCDLYGSGRSLYLSQARHSLVARNQLYNGRWGWYCLEGSDGLFFEHNTVVGADLMSTGGGIANYGTACSRYVYFAYNDMRFAHGWDREIMTTDAGGEAYFGKIAKANGAELLLAGDPQWGPRNWTNGGVFILDGKGAGQWRWIKAYEGRKLTLDRPWEIPPDDTSVVGITMFHGRYVFIGNRFTDCGAFQFYGTSIECDVVRNEGTRMGAFQALGLWYHGFQPSWYCQFLGNTIHEGNYYHWTAAQDSVISLFGARRAEYQGPLLRGAVVRNNRLEANSHIHLAGSCANVLVTQNRVAHSDMGVFVSRDCQDVLVEDNQFVDVAHELMDEPALRQAAQERLAKYLQRPAPILALPFEQAQGNVTPDVSGNNFHARLQGGAKLVPGGVAGHAVAFDGTGYLQINEPAVFNAPDLTIDFWMKPLTLKGRRGLVAKRWANAGCPFVINQTGAAVGFEAMDEQGKWSLNFSSPPVLKENEWARVTVVMKTGEGVRIYINGQPVAEKANALGRAENLEPLIIGREAWGGDPPSGDTPGFFLGLMDELRIWTRALSDAEIAARQ